MGPCKLTMVNGMFNSFRFDIPLIYLLTNNLSLRSSEKVNFVLKFLKNHIHPSKYLRHSQVLEAIFSGGSCSIVKTVFIKLLENF